MTMSKVKHSNLTHGFRCWVGYWKRIFYFLFSIFYFSIKKYKIYSTFNHAVTYCAATGANIFFGLAFDFLVDAEPPPPLLALA